MGSGGLPGKTGPVNVTLKKKEKITMKSLELNLETPGKTGSEKLQFNVTRMVNAGYVGRDMAVVRAHIEELAKEGVPEPANIPMVFPVTCSSITTENKIEVVGKDTSGEIEYVLFLTHDQVYVGIGSDHTDRQVETLSIVKSKQVCPNLVSQTVWPLEAVLDRWDDLMMECRVIPGIGAGETIYQSDCCGKIIHPTDLIDLVRSGLVDGQDQGMVIFSGTIPFIPEEMIYGTTYRCSLTDQATGARLTCAYEVEKLNFLGDV